MRISTNQFYQSGLNSILDQQSKLNRTQQQIATGERVMTPSDDPVAAISIINLEREIALTQRYMVNGEKATANLNIEETTLKSVTDILHRVKELVLSAGNPTYGDTERNILATEMENLLQQLVGLANVKDSSGDYLFSGNSISTTPYTQDAAGGFQYNGDQGERNVQISTNTQLSMGDSGYQLFQNILNGNGDFVASENLANTGDGVISPGIVADKSAYVSDTYTITMVDLGAGALGYNVTDSGGATVIPDTAYVAGTDISFNGISFNISGTPVIGDEFSITPSNRQDIFTTLQNAIAALQQPTGTTTAAADQAHRNGALQRALVDLSQGIEHIGIVHADVGTRLNRLQNQNMVNYDFILTSRTTLSTVRDLDMAEAITNLNLQKVGLEASQASFVRIQNLNLFNFLR